MIPVRIGKYAVIRKIASGGMAEVYLCRLRGEEGFEKKVAVKVIHPRLGDSPRFRELFAREARIAASLAHSNLIQVFDFGTEGRSCFLAMEYVDGWNMAQVASHARLRSIPVPLSVWRYWMEGILAGLGHLHSKGIVHRDISPSNILLSRGGVVKITDFGISRAVQGGIRSSECWEGKFSYMSPEQARGGESDSGSDLFAAAAIAAELYLPARLFDAGSVEDAFARMRAYDFMGLDIGALPAPIAGVAKKGLATAREDRYLDADEFIRAVCDAVPYAPVRADLHSFWSALFPEGTGDDDTAAAENISLGGTDSVRESRAEYGKRNVRLVKIGVIAAAAISAAAWMAIIDDSRPASDVSRNAGAPSPAPAGISGTEPVNPPDARTLHGGAREYPSVTSLGSIHGNRSEKSVRAPEDASGIPLSAGREIPAATASNLILLETDPPGAAVSLDDGTPLGKTPVKIDRAPIAGRKIVFRRDGYYEKVVQADVLARFSAFRMEMERQMGTIEVVQAIPWANVYEGDRYIGVTPIRRLDLPVGTHRLRFVNEPLSIENIQEINVRPGDNPRLIVPLVGKGKSE